jgi:hypothetical protein
MPQRLKGRPNHLSPVRIRRSALTGDRHGFTDRHGETATVWPRTHEAALQPHRILLEP